MVFSKEYDRSLWLMLVSDINKDKIAEVISNIPSDLSEQIRLYVKEYNQGIRNHSWLKYSKNNITYEIKLVFDELFISMIRIGTDGKKYISDLKLMPINKKDIVDMYYYRNLYFADFDTYVDNGYDMEHEIMNYYSIMKNFFGCYVIAYDFHKKDKTKFINFDKIPKEIYQHQFNDEKRINRLVKKRSKGGKYLK